MNVGMHIEYALDEAIQSFTLKLYCARYPCSSRGIKLLL
jgi:hypothetical protein